MSGDSTPSSATERDGRVEPRWRDDLLGDLAALPTSTEVIDPAGVVADADVAEDPVR